MYGSNRAYTCMFRSAHLFIRPYTTTGTYHTTLVFQRKNVLINVGLRCLLWPIKNGPYVWAASRTRKDAADTNLLHFAQKGGRPRLILPAAQDSLKRGEECPPRGDLEAVEGPCKGSAFRRGPIADRMKAKWS